MKWTRLSFVYLITYLTVGGVGLLAAPALATGLLGSAAEYPAPLLRLVGALLCALAVVVFQIRRHHVAVLYPTTLVVRGLIMIVLVAGYLESRDILFLTLLGIVGVGVVLTGLGLVTDRHGAPAAPEHQTP